MNKELNSPSRVTESNPQTYRFEFSGSGAEYFKIWIVNLLLSIITLGIYSAWAKVRSNQYIYRSIKLDKSGFDYHGSPVAILKGRIIMVVLILSLNLSQQINVFLYLAVLVLFLVILPWLTVRSLSFRMRNSSWRGIRFSFRGTVSESAVCLYGYGLVTLITGGLGYPVQIFKLKKFLFENTFFGKTRISLNITTGGIYLIFLQMFLFSLGLIITVSTVGIVIAATADKDTYQVTIIPIITMLLYLSFLLLMYPFYKTKMTNLLWNNTYIGISKFVSTLTAPGFMKLVLINFFLTLITLGFYWPWAVMNLTRYRISNLSLEANESLENFIADTTADVEAIGEEIIDGFDFDISF